MSSVEDSIKFRFLIRLFFLEIERGLGPILTWFNEVVRRLTALLQGESD